MRKILTLSGLCLTAFLLTACNEDQVPSTAQVKLWLPDEILTCKDAPRSPGSGASAQVRARYILALYDAWEDCNGNLATVRPLYQKYRKNLERVARGDYTPSKPGKVKTNFNR